MKPIRDLFVGLAVFFSAMAAPTFGQDAAGLARATQQRIGKLLDDVLPTLDKTVERIDVHDSLPEKTINPFDTDKMSNRNSINALLDAAIDALEVSEVTGYRQRIRDVQASIRQSHTLISEYRRKRLSASNASELGRIDKVNPLVKSREEFDELVKSEEKQIKSNEAELEKLKQAFASHLNRIGLVIDEDGVDSLLGSISGDDFVSMVAVFDNIKQLTTQLQALTDESDESLDTAKRYYGMYVVLVQTMDRLQNTFIQDVETDHIPRLHEFAAQAQQNIDEARHLIKTGGGDADVLRANIISNQTTQQAAQIYVQHLQDSARTVARENKQIKRNLATAQNTYKTVRLSSDVALLMQTGRRNFEALMRLKVPTVREFGNEAIKKEFERMTLELRK